MADPTVVELANQMAEECLAVQRETGQERLFMEVAAVLGASSQTMEEAFVTAIRTRLAAAQGRDFMAKALAARRAKES